jgi:hypothetical protein
MQTAATTVRAQGDPRVGLRAGLTDAAEAAWNLQLVAHVNKSDRFFNPENAGDFAFANADLAFDGCARRSSAPAARATCPCSATCSSCRSRRRAAAWIAGRKA